MCLCYICLYVHIYLFIICIYLFILNEFFGVVCYNFDLQCKKKYKKTKHNIPFHACMY